MKCSYDLIQFNIYSSTNDMSFQRRDNIVYCCLMFILFVFKQKTAYDMRISDWSSDVCSSDLLANAELERRVEERTADLSAANERLMDTLAEHLAGGPEIGRASCRERVCQYV